MGMVYKGVEYHYAFEFNVPLENGSNRSFDIVISNYRDKFHDFSGLCLSNEIKVISIQTMPYAAFFDIVSQIIELTIQSEKAYAEINPGKTLSPLMTVEDPVFRGEFEECRKTKKSLDWYEGLKKYIEGSANMPESAQKEITKFHLVDAQNMSFFNDQIRSASLPITTADFFRIGVGLQRHG